MLCLFVVDHGSGRARTFKQQKSLMLPQRVILGVGLAVLLIISAASISLDIKARSDAVWVNHTLEVMNKISEVQLMVRRAESASRGFGLIGEANLLNEFQEARDRIAPAFAELKDELRDNPGQLKLVQNTEPLITRRIAVSAELIERRKIGDTDGINTMIAGAEGRTLMLQLSENLDRVAAEEERLLTVRNAGSQRTGVVLMSIDLAGASLILLLVAAMMREGRELQTSLHATEAAKQSLEDAVAERTEHLLAAHEELRRSTSVLKNTFNSMAEAVLVIDPKGEVMLSNPAAERMLRYKPGMNVQKLRALITVFQADGTTPIALEDMPASRALRGEQFDEQEIVVRPLAGRAARHLVISGRPLREKSGAISGAALVYHDISASRDTERRLQEAQKLEAIGKLTGGVAHDFNNMLTVITGNTETLVARLKDHPELSAVARLIDDAAERCAELVKHLLAFARKQPLRPHNVDINKAVTDVAKLLRPTLGEQIEITTVLGHDVTATHVDPSQLANSVINMALNARDAMPDGGRLVLETSTVVLDEAYVAANPDVTAGPYVVLAISDNGSGMKAEVRERAFEPFFTTKEVGQGSGLGLSMVYGFVKQSGGHIKVYSEEGQGTTIRLYLPPARGKVEAIAADGGEVTGGSETILVVEDDALVRGSVTTQLRSLGYKTITVNDGPAAMALVARGEAFDLLFTDVILPGGMSGRALADALARLRPSIKVLFTSGYTDNAVVHHGRLDEGVLLLTKPYRRPQLAQMLRQALGPN
jgi:signal transduction histidine kinase/CHASE3 domain sensor protein